MNKKSKTLLWICIALGIVLCLLVLFLCVSKAGGVKRLFRGFKAPEAYTWEEYQSMSNEDQDEFFQRFDSVEEFEEWKEAAQPKETLPDFHWDEPGKQPDAYSWEEYQALSPEKKEAFYLWFPTKTAFEDWKNRVQPEELPSEPRAWDETGKQPNEYTWNEYQALSPEEQDAFFLWFSSVDDFEAWMKGAKPEEDTADAPAWNLSGKEPKEYTWTEYQALGPEDQDAFFLWFGSVDAFEAWMEAVKPGETEPQSPIWNKPGKEPNQYTWDEYQALTLEEQDAFFLWFDNLEAFEAWAEQAQKE